MVSTRIGALAAILVALAALPSQAAANRVPIKGNSATQVEGRCNESGGVYSPPSKSGVYVCLNPDGSGIVCGGGTAEQKETCDKFRVGSPDARRVFQSRLKSARRN
jgi:hypothetical protein